MVVPIGGGPLMRGLTSRGKARLTTPEDTLCENAGEWYPILGTFVGGGDNDVKFSTDEDGIVTFDGLKNSFIIFTGVVDLVANKACNMLLTLRYNGVATGDPTPHEFVPFDKIANLTGQDFFRLNKGDTLQAVIQSDVANTTFNVQALVGLLFGAP